MEVKSIPASTNHISYAALNSTHMVPDVEPIGGSQKITDKDADNASQGSMRSEEGIEMQTRGRRDSIMSDVGKVLAPIEDVPLVIGLNILVMLFILGLTTGVVNGSAQWANSKISWMQAQLLETTEAGPFFFMLTTAALAALSALIIKRGGSAAAIGSGMPEVKALLQTDFHRSEFPLIVSFRILCIRLSSLICAVGSGLSIGIAAPLVHVSICTAYTLMNKIPDFGEFLENHAIRKQVFAAAAAVGMTTVFNAPVGGLLLSIELTSTFYLTSNYWRSFMATTAGGVMYSIFLLARHERGRIFQVAFIDDPFLDWEFAMYGVLGATAGLLALQYLKLHQAWFLFVKPYTLKYPVGTAAVAGAVTALLIYASGAHSAKGVGESVIVHDALQDCSISMMSSINGVNPLGALFASLIVRVFLTLIGTTLRISCGVFLPVLTIGSLLGRIFGQILADICGNSVNVYVAGYAMVGAVAFVSGTTHTISVAVIVIEQTGQFNMLLPCLVGAVIACGITKSRSLSLYDQGMVNKGLESFDLLLKESGGFKYAADVMDPTVNFVHTKCTVGDLVGLLSSGRQSTFPVTTSSQSNRLIGSLDRQDIFAFLKSIFETEQLYGYIRLKLATDAHYDDRRQERLKQIQTRRALSQNIESSMQGILGLRLSHQDEDDEDHPTGAFKGKVGMLTRNLSRHNLGEMRDGFEDEDEEYDGSHHTLSSGGCGFDVEADGDRVGTSVPNPLIFTPEVAALHKEFFTPTQPTAHSQLDDAKSATSGSDATGENKKKLSRRPSSFPLTASQSSEALIAMTGGILNFAQRLAIIPGVGVVQERQAQKAGVMSTSDQARVEELLDQPIDIAQEAMLPINGFPFTAHRYTTMDQLYVLFEMVKVNVVFIITNSKRLEGMISKGQLMQQLKKTVKR